MSLSSRARAIAHHSMRAYFIPIIASLALIVCVFLPWVVIGRHQVKGFPDLLSLWVLGLGGLGLLLASLSIVTRKNSRHPLLVVGLAALGIMFTAYRLMARSASEHAWASSQAVAIVDQTEARPQEATKIGSGVYLGLAASSVLVLFGLTIVVKRVAKPYAEVEDDDVE